MTSFAFIAGLLPLVVATGPGAIYGHVTNKDELRAAATDAAEAVIVEYDPLVAVADPDLEVEYGEAWFDLANLHSELGEKTKACSDYEQMGAIFAQLTAAFPNMPDYRLELAKSHNNLEMLPVEFLRKLISTQDEKTATWLDGYLKAGAALLDRSVREGMELSTAYHKQLTELMQGVVPRTWGVPPKRETVTGSRSEIDGLRRAVEDAEWGAVHGRRVLEGLVRTVQVTQLLNDGDEDSARLITARHLEV